MGINSPLPVRLEDETRKAAKILRSFVDSSNNGLDKVIPRSVLERAKGFAIFTVFKAGFLFSARAGSGVVIARTPDGSWSPPSAIGLGGFGFGGQAGAEMTDFLVVLNSRSAVSSFMSAGSVTLGGNLSVAVGPLGRNAEGSGTLNTKGRLAAMYSYSKTKGLFGGVSVEGSVIVERQDANRLAYGGNPSAKQILSGAFDAPDWAYVLTHELERCTGGVMGDRWREDEEGEGGGMSATPPPRSWDDKGGRSRSGSGASAGGGYVFGEGIGGGGHTPPREDGRKRSGSVLNKNPPTQRPPATKRSSSFNPFSSSSGSAKGGNGGAAPPSSESYNAGLTWDSDGPMSSSGYATRARSGSSGLRREIGSAFSTDAGHGEGRAGKKEDDLLGEWNSGSRRSSGSRGGETDLLGAWDAAPNGNGLTPAFARLSTHGHGAGGGNRSRSNSRPKPFEDILEGEYAPYETTSSFGRGSPARNGNGNGNGSPSHGGEPGYTNGGGSGTTAKRATRPFSSSHVQASSPFGEGSSQERRPFDDYFPSSSQPQGHRRTESSPRPNLSLKPGLVGLEEQEDEGYARAVALFDFVAAQEGDLGFRKGEVVLVLDKVGEAGEWWRGRKKQRQEGIFPRDYVEVLSVPKELRGGVSRSQLMKRVADLGFD